MKNLFLEPEKEFIHSSDINDTLLLLNCARKIQSNVMKHSVSKPNYEKHLRILNVYVNSLEQKLIDDLRIKA